MAWHGFEIVCIDLADDSEYSDPRAITHVGYEAPSLTISPLDKVAAIQASNVGTRPFVHLKVNGTPVVPEVKELDGTRYLRVADDFSPDDPLMGLPTCDEHEYAMETEHIS